MSTLTVEDIRKMAELARSSGIPPFVDSAGQEFYVLSNNLRADLTGTPMNASAEITEEQFIKALDFYLASDPVFCLRIETWEDQGDYFKPVDDACFDGDDGQWTVRGRLDGEMQRKKKISAEEIRALVIDRLADCVLFECVNADEIDGEPICIYMASIREQGHCTDTVAFQTVPPHEIERRELAELIPASAAPKQRGGRL